MTQVSMGRAPTIMVRDAGPAHARTAICALVLLVGVGEGAATVGTHPDVGTIPCTANLRDRHNPGLAEATAKELCFEAYISNFDVGGATQEPKVPPRRVPLWVAQRVEWAKASVSEGNERQPRWFTIPELNEDLVAPTDAYIHESAFDIRRMPEYYNRIIPGTIGGGAFVLFVDHLVGEGGEPIALSAAALGFLGGYSTDFLFNSIERLIAAILPKVGLESVRRHGTSPGSPLDGRAGDLTLKDLVDRYEASTDDQKALYKSLIEKLRDRL